MNSWKNAELKGKKILLRVDFDVPVSEEHRILEKFRVERQKPMLDHLINSGARIVMVSHISDKNVSSFNGIIVELSGILGREIEFINKIEDITGFNNNLGLLENIRHFEGEKENNKDFAGRLSNGFDAYINNCFAVSHRNHASVSAVTEFLPGYAGILIEEEVAQLKKAIDGPGEGKLVIIGGAKAETKVPVIKNFIDKADKIILGGVVANDILKERGVNIDSSIADENSKELLNGLDIFDKRLIMAEDFNAPGGKILDIGPKSIINFSQIIREAKMIIWNGPMGLFENPDYSEGTFSIARTMADLKCYRVIGGGDTITAVNGLGLLDRFDFVSTGGGAMLAFLGGDKLPGLEVLGYYS
jgi:phosphoglycerate kinase